MAAADAAGGQPAAAHGAVLAQRIDGVMGAGREETAAPAQERGQQQLVATQQIDQQAAHGAALAGAAAGADARFCAGNFSNCVNSWRRAVFRAVVVAGPCLVLTGRARRTMQSRAGKGDRRNNSRATRLIVLRVTARGAKRLATTTPRRACSTVLGRVYSTKWALFCAGRKRKTDENSSVFTIRRARAKSCEPSIVMPPVTAGAGKLAWLIQPDACGPWRGVRSAHHDRHGWPYVRGSRACACDERRKVGKYVSWWSRLKLN